MTKYIDFRPNWVSPPGETIADILEERALSVNQFAERMGYSTKHIAELLRGSAVITIEIARKLEVILGGSAAFWMIRETQYRDDVTRIQSEKTSSTDVEWVRDLPLKDMIKFGWLKPVLQIDKVATCLHFLSSQDVSRKHTIGEPIVCLW